MRKKVLVLVISSDTYPSVRNRKIIEKTWLIDSPENIEVFFYKAGHKTEVSKQNEITLAVGKSSKDISEKNIMAFEYALENFDFDFLFRTTTTSYVKLDELNSFIERNHKESKYLYCGRVMETNDLSNNKQTFVSGAGILFTRDTIKKIIENKKKLDYRLWDDVGLGKLLKKLGIDASIGQREDIKGNIFRHDFSYKHYHYRCRIDNHYGYPRFLEYYVIKYLHFLLNKKSINKFKKIIFSSLFEVSKQFYVQYPFFKIYTFLKTLLKKILPRKIFSSFKKKFQTLNKKIQLRYFKY
jgi:hypothetical protein